MHNKKTAYLHRQAEMSHVNKKIKLAVLNTDGKNLHCKCRHYFPLGKINAYYLLNKNRLPLQASGR